MQSNGAPRTVKDNQTFATENCGHRSTVASNDFICYGGLLVLFDQFVGGGNSGWDRLYYEANNYPTEADELRGGLLVSRVPVDVTGLLVV